ncbi:MAG: hypothetical protein H7249_11630 [Chitinophagaceae bacterium]|nr:hypothetical protein [Oligoflexus sp.]
MKSELKYAFLGLISYVLVACESVPDEVRVLEKSRMNPPAWIAEGLGFKPTPYGFHYVLCKDKVLNLPLGLIQTENGVLYNLKFQMFKTIQSHVDAQKLSAQSSRDFNEQLSKILDKRLTKTNIRDFYYDKISNPLTENGLIPEYYQIYALAQIDTVQATSIAADVKAFVKSYPSEDLRSQINSLSQF